MASLEAGRGALLLIDIQYDFLTGSLAVASGLDILPHVYRLMDEGKWDLVVASQDHHPDGHISFASRHSKPPFTIIDLTTAAGAPLRQELWPDHCVQGTRGAEFEDGVKSRLEQWEKKGKGKVVRKGEDRELDEYSAFRGDAKTGTLGKWLQHNGIKELFVVGLATDFCVRFSVLEALAGLSQSTKVYVVSEAVRGVDPEKSKDYMRELEEKGAFSVSIDGPEVKRWLS